MLLLKKNGKEFGERHFYANNHGRSKELMINNMEIKNKKIKKMKKIKNKDQEKILRKQKKLTANFMVNKETLIQIQF